MTRLPHRALLCIALGCALAPLVTPSPRVASRSACCGSFPPVSRRPPTRSSSRSITLWRRARSLGRSFGVVRVEPRVPATAYWRDPSTIVVRFAEPLSFGARYTVSSRPRCGARMARRLAAGQERELRVRKPGLLRFLPSGGRSARCFAAAVGGLRGAGPARRARRGDSSRTHGRFLPCGHNDSAARRFHSADPPSDPL